MKDGAQRHEQDLLGAGGPLPLPLGGAVALAGADEGVDRLVDPVGVRLEGLRDQDDGAGGAAAERVGVAGSIPFSSSQRLEARVVRPAALGLLRLGPHRLGDLLLVPLPGDEVRRERDGRDAPAVREDTGRVRGDVVQHEVRLVALVRLDELRQRLDRVGQEGLDVVEECGSPGRRGRRRGTAASSVQSFGSAPGLRDLLGEGGRDRVRDPVSAGDELPDHLDARVHVPVGGDGEHGDVGGAWGRA